MHLPLFAREGEEGVERAKHNTLAETEVGGEGSLSPPPWCELSVSPSRTDECCLSDAVATAAARRTGLRVGGGGVLLGRADRRRKEEGKKDPLSFASQCVWTLPYLFSLCVQEK